MRKWWFSWIKNRNWDHDLPSNALAINERWPEAWHGELPIPGFANWAAVAHFFNSEAYQEKHSHIIQKMLEFHND